MEVAHRIHKIATERYGLSASDLIFDALTFPIGTGDEDLRKDGIATLEAIKRIKSEIPGAFTTLGLSNVSFGLSPATRQVLNSVFLHEAREVGLDSAIVHASKILPLSRIPDEQIEVCQDLIFDRRSQGYDPLTKLLEIFADVSTIDAVKEDRTDWTIEQILRQRIIDGDREGLIDDLNAARSQGIAPLDIINEVLQLPTLNSSWKRPVKARLKENLCWPP